MRDLFIMPGCTASGEWDKEERWRRAQLGYVLTPAEVERM